jgi:oxygen-independent coproporphyrinogen-3 oxidase|tara:strand:+ start:343 stop:1704 length:1362 start_codon:yes stop_codon:yes gene_type:complete
MGLFDIDLINKYNRSGPRYTSYPTANNFSELSLEDYKQQSVLSNRRKTSISLYCHIPFCDTVCYYCGCNKVVTKDKSRAEPYIDALFKEIEMQSSLFDKERLVEQMHFGGGTPTFLSKEQIIRLSNKLQQSFNFSPNGEYSIEIDPRGIDEDLIESLTLARFNRISLGVQDFDLKVQKAVNRVQSFKQTKAVVEISRKNGFKSISIDLIYGLPRQSKDTFKRTLEKVKELRPDRISLFNYAHLPELFKPQRRIVAEELPSPSEKLNIFQYSLEYLIGLGYIYIGMDHFALPDDPLAIAQSEGNLYRNFQGYSTHSECDIVGLGLSSIGQVADSFSQNEKSLEKYYQALESGQLPINKGLIINQDDKIRRALIMELICHFEVNISRLEERYSIKFTNYFADSFEKLVEMQNDGLVELKSDSIKVMDRGKLLVRNICMLFDSYLELSDASFSKTI